MQNYSKRTALKLVKKVSLNEIKKDGYKYHHQVLKGYSLKDIETIVKNDLDIQRRAKNLKKRLYKRLKFI